MHFWYLLNPLHNKETVECRILFTLLKVIYDPYTDGSDTAFNYLVDDTGRLINDIKRLELELEPQMDFDTLQVMQQREGIWHAADLIRELVHLTNNFQEYKHGQVKLPSMKYRDIMMQKMKECTFHPKIAL
jgi:hypothetical protein